MTHKRRLPTLKQQMTRLVNMVVDIRQSMKGLATKEELRELRRELKEDIRAIREELHATREELRTTREELHAAKEDLKSDIKELADHTHAMLQRHVGSHQRVEEKLENHEKRLTIVEAK